VYINNFFVQKPYCLGTASSGDKQCKKYIAPWVKAHRTIISGSKCKAAPAFSGAVSLSGPMLLADYLVYGETSIASRDRGVSNSVVDLCFIY
jgi:hypothetical protein